MNIFRRFVAITVVSTTGFVVAAEPVTYSTHIRKIFRDNCANCHNTSRKQAGLDLSSYTGSLQGSSSGHVLIKGDPDDSILYLSMTHAEEPAMPPGKAPLKKAILEQVRVWIETGLPEQPDDVEESVSSVPPATSVAAASGSTQPASDAAFATSDDVFAGTNGNPVTALAVAPDGALAAVAGQLQVLLFNLEKSEFVGALPYPEGEIFALKFTTNGQYLLAGGGTAAEAGNVVIWSMASRRRVHVVGDDYDVVMGTDISPDGSLVIYGGPDRIVRIANLDRRTIIAELKKHTDWVTATAFSPEGLIFTTADRDGSAYVWETQTQAPLHTLRGHSKAITAVQWSSDGNYCLTASEDGTVRVWSMHTGETDRQWMAHEGGTLSMNVSLSGDVVTAGRDGFIRRWSMEGKQLDEVEPDAIPTRVAFAGDDIVAADWAGNVRVWNADEPNLIALSVPESKRTSDATSLVVEVTGPEPIVEKDISVAATTPDEQSAVDMTSTVTSGGSTELDSQLAEARAALLNISRQLNRAAPIVNGKATPQTLRDALAAAAQIADNIPEPSQAVVEARVFLTAALERSQRATSSGAKGSPDNDTTTATAANVRGKLAAINADLAVVTAECRRMESEYTAIEAHISTLTERSLKLRADYVGYAETLKHLTELSARLDRQLQRGTLTTVVGAKPAAAN